MRSGLIALLGVAALLAAGLVPAPAWAGTDWTYYTYVPAATLAGARGANRMIEEVEKATKGDLKIDYHIAGSLPINSTNITQAVADGIIQVGDDGFYQGNIPIGGILRLPMLITTPEEFAKAQQIMMPYIERAYARKGVLVLGSYYYPLQIAWSRRKLESFADMKGQKMRVTSPEQAEFVRRFGGIPLTLGGDEVPSALDRGVADGVFTAPSGGGKIWHDLLKYCYQLGPNYFDALVIVNRAAFDALSPADQQALRDAVAGQAPWITKQLYIEDSEVANQLKAGGMIVTPAKPEDVEIGAKLLAPFWDQWAKAHGPDAVEALAKVRQALGR
jgi:TRAP-type C4-dicarboxylate transport system substrate-binding protein